MEKKKQNSLKVLSLAVAPALVGLGIKSVMDSPDPLQGILLVLAGLACAGLYELLQVHQIDTRVPDGVDADFVERIADDVSADAADTIRNRWENRKNR